MTVTEEPQPLLWLTPIALRDAGPVGLVKNLERILLHLGFDDVRIIDGANDGGADILAVRGQEEWVIQSKWSLNKPINSDGVDEVDEAFGRFDASHAILATNQSLSKPGQERVKQLTNIGLRIDVWNGETIRAVSRSMPDYVPVTRENRDYQLESKKALINDIDKHGRGLLMLATGLGKTVVGGEVIAHYLRQKPGMKVLVLSHLKELSAQLERAMWRHIPKTVPTQLLTGDFKPSTLDGLTAATIETALKTVHEGYRPDLIMIDEAHHVGENGQYRALLDLLEGVPYFGVTATPWRGDEFDLTHLFGPPSMRVGIAQGMAEGYLSQVDYQILVDNFNWDLVKDQSKYGYSIKELNRSLFLPQRDAEIVENIRVAWNSTVGPRAIMFCQTIEHSEDFAALLRRSDPEWSTTTALHSGLSMQQRQIVLNQFRLGRTPMLTCVDVLNEGVDVPDVNIIGFLRVTHSRRIFIQQLGRGLRLAQNKTSLKVLDFVTDIRRVAATLNLRRELEGERERLELTGQVAEGIRFSNETTGALLDSWIEDAADLETSADEVRLQFPDSFGIH